MQALAKYLSRGAFKTIIIVVSGSNELIDKPVHANSTTDKAFARFYNSSFSKSEMEPTSVNKVAT